VSFVSNERFQGNLDNSSDNIKNNIINLKKHTYYVKYYLSIQSAPLPVLMNQTKKLAHLNQIQNYSALNLLHYIHIKLNIYNIEIMLYNTITFVFRLQQKLLLKFG